MKCDHPGFDVDAKIARMSDTGQFQADIKIVCHECGTPMRFLGLPMGLDMNGAAVSPDGTEGRFAILPVGEPMPDGPAGFRLLRHDQE